jgi:hypothetical protein
MKSFFDIRILIDIFQLFLLMNTHFEVKHRHIAYFGCNDYGTKWDQVKPM